MKKHRVISLKIVDKLILFFGNRLGCWPPKRIWYKQRPLKRLYNEGKTRMDEMLDVSKILREIRATKILLEHGFLSEAVKKRIDHTEVNLIDLEEELSDSQS
jgi:hypothetical protein